MSTTPSLQPGCIMEFLQDNQPVTAWVLDVQGPRLRVFTAGQRELKLPVSRVLPWTGPQCAAGSSRQDMLDLLRTHNGRRERLAEDDFLPAETVKDGTTYMARKPTPAEADDLLFAWAVEAGVTSNSIIFARDGATVSIGTGEQDRVGCVELTIQKAYTKYADRLAFVRHNLSLYELKMKARDDAALAASLQDILAKTEADKGGLPGTVLVSDGFFPFRDGVDLAIAQGVTAIAQPGGSIRDWEIIQAVNEASPQVAMVFTGQRSFKH